MALNAAIDNVTWIKTHTAAILSNPTLFSNYEASKNNYLSQVPDNLTNQYGAITSQVSS